MSFYFLSLISGVCKTASENLALSLHIQTEWQQSKMFFTFDERGLKIVRNSVFDYHLSPVGRQMAIENSVSMIFFQSLSIVLMFSIATYLCGVI